MHEDRTLRNVQNTSFGYGTMHMPTPADTSGSAPAAKRARVEEVLQQHAPREQLLVSELMGWRSSSQEPQSAMGTGAVSNGSTDFRALFARQPSQQQHPALQRASNTATTGLRTFADVASRPAAAPEDMGRQEVLCALRTAYNSTAGGAGTGLGRSASQQPWPGALDAGGATAAAAAAGGTLDDLAPEQLPVDWGIKRSMTFTSTARFGIHDKAQQAPPRTRWRALQAVVNNDMDTGADEVVQYLSCQLSWRHPEALMDAAALAAVRSASGATGPAAAAAATAGGGTTLVGAACGAAGSGGGVLAQRLTAWRNALHSLYGTYRGGDCDVFYVISSASRAPFVALFAGKGVRGSSELVALVSQSSRALRGRMLAAGVPFTMPLEGGPAAGGGGAAGAGKAGYEAGVSRPEKQEDDAADVGLCDEARQAGPSSGAPAPGSTVADNSRESLLMLRGPRAVHGLYDFLMNETSYPGVGGRMAGGGGGGLGDEMSDLPLLLAPVPFDGGAVWRPPVKALTLNSKVAADAGDLGPAPTLSAAPPPPPSGVGDPDSGVAVHVLQVSGPLPPWTSRRLCALMARLQPSGFSASLETEPSSITLNSRVVEGADAAAAAAAPQLRPTFAQGGALTAEELMAWQQPSALPGGRPVKGVTCGGSRRLSVRV